MGSSSPALPYVPAERVAREKVGKANALAATAALNAAVAAAEATTGGAGAAATAAPTGGRGRGRGGRAAGRVSGCGPSFRSWCWSRHKREGKCCCAS